MWIFKAERTSSWPLRPSWTPQRIQHSWKGFSKDPTLPSWTVKRKQACLCKRIHRLWKGFSKDPTRPSWTVKRRQACLCKRIQRLWKGYTRFSLDSLLVPSKQVRGKICLKERESRVQVSWKSPFYYCIFLGLSEKKILEGKNKHPQNSRKKLKTQA